MPKYVSGGQLFMGYAKWFEWVMFRLLGVPLVLLVALVLAAVLVPLLLRGIAVEQGIIDGIVSGFVTLAIALVAAQFAQVYQEVVSHRYPYPLASSSSETQSPASSPTPLNRGEGDGVTPSPNGGNHRRLEPRPFNRQDVAAMAVPIALLIASVGLLFSYGVIPSVVRTMLTMLWF